jgi:tRNA(fMet)-specific endonuclease VapC
VTSYMLDTNICSFLIRHRPPAVGDRLAAAETSARVSVSAITGYELSRGAFGKPRFKMLVEAFLARIAILPWDREAAACAARIYGQLSEQGRRIGENDTLIAGHALAAHCMLVTNNTREFARVAGLQIEDWS